MNRFLRVSFFFVINLHCLYAQNEWHDLTPSQERNFFDIQRSFENEMGNQVYSKGKGIKQFRRWEYYWGARVDETGDFPPEGNVNLEMLNYYRSHPIIKSYSSGSGNWSEVGPISKPINGTGQPNGNGRLNCITFHPTDSNTIFVGAPSGGFWKSTDNGASWRKYVTGMVRLGISSIVVHPTSPDTIYIGTGDRDAGDAPGYGVWRSTDGGMTWSAHNNGMGNRTVYEIIMDPANSNIMIASTNSRIYRTTDGGANWTQAFSGHSCKDIAMHPVNNNILYASGTNFYRSTDNGVSWSQITSGVPTGSSRMALAVSANQPDYVYILAGSGSGLLALSRSTDSGQNFSQRSNAPNILGYASDGSDSGSQAWYDLVLAADPTNADALYSGGVNIWKSVDGGQTWTISAHWTGSGGADDVHADHHALAFSPHNNHLYNGNDGGLYISADGGVVWNEYSSGLAIAQVYKIGVAQTVENTVINGYQDNGTAICFDGSFTTEIGGDGMECIIDHSDENYMYGALYYGNVRRSTNMGSNFSTIADNGVNGINESGGWVTPYTLDPNNSARMYVGYKNVWRSDDVKSPAANAINWTRISNLGQSGNLIDIAIAPSNSDVMYVSKSLSGSLLFKTTDASAASPTFNSLQAGLPNNNIIKDIEIDPLDPSHLFIAQGNKIYESSDGGTSWTDISGTLPDIPLNTIVIDHNSALAAMYIGMDVGVYYRDNTMADWTIYNDSLPNVEITELEIHYGIETCKSMLYAATYGQGLWKSDLKAPVNSTPVACFSASVNNICGAETIELIDNSIFTVSTWSWSIAPSTFIYSAGTNSNSQNPKIQFNAPGSYSVQLIVGGPMGGDTLIKNDFIIVEEFLPTCNFNEDFESDTLCSEANDCALSVCPLSGYWTNLVNDSQDDIDWRVDSAGTVSNGTGPSIDYNPGTTSGNYLYLEASGCAGQTAILESQCVFLEHDYFLKIAYHMFGNDMGNLHFDIFFEGAWIEDVYPPLSGDNGDLWQQVSIDLTAYTGNSIKFRIRGITGNGFASDMAIDDIVFDPIPQFTSPVSSCDSYTWLDGNTYTTSNNSATWTLTNASGCDSTVTLDLTITNSNTGSQTVTECDSYTWNSNGQSYTQSGQYTSVLTNQSGCDSTVTLNLTITNSNTVSETVTECNSYTWSTDGQTYTQSGQYTSILTNQSGCDSTVILNLTITNSNTGSETVTECDSYTWNTNGQTYIQSGQYTSVLTNQVGCDSTVTLNLTITNSNTGFETVTECNSYTWSTNGQTYTQSGQYTEVLTNQVGCDSTVTLNLTITNSNTGSETVTECDSYTWNTNGQTYTQSGQYAEVLTSQVGCDSTVILNLTITNSNTGFETVTECNSFTWGANNQTYTQSGQYTEVLTNQVGCDSTVTLNLTITNSNTGSETVTECDSYTWNTNGQTYTQSGQYTEVLTNQDGCDSTVTLNLTIINSNTGSQTVTECDSYTWNTNGQTYTQSGQYTSVLTNQSGCDSTVTLNLTITNSNTVSETVTECNSYTWITDGQTYTQSGQYTSILTNQSGCDSTVILNLTITNSNTGSETVTECDSYTWNTNGQTYTQSGQYTSVLTNQVGCDSTVTLNLTITNSNTGSETVTECDSYTWNTNGQTYTQSGQYTEVLTNQDGCDSTVTLNLTIINSNTGSQTVTECNSYTWSTNGQTYTQSGQYTEVLTNQVGCDSTVTLNLTITNSNTGSETVTECDSYTWNTNGQTYTQSGQYTEVLTNQVGCDSTVTLNLTITNSNTGSETVTECDSYTWNTNGQTYTQSGQYTSVLTNQSGCDSTVTLNLTITNSNTGFETVTECDSYTWNANGQTYTQSGQYTEVLTNQSGCDSTVTLNLTITNSNTGSETVTECDSYTWNTNGQTYTQSGQYTEVLTNQVGCDSTVTLNLTITNSNTGSETVTECNSYTWSTNGQTYTQSGQYTEVITNQSGCDSTVTLNLTITNSNTGSETVTECNSYTWSTNGQIYTQSGQYTEVLTNQSGCDSTVTLNLTIETVDITTQPVDQTVVVGNNGQFTVTTSATNPSYQWQMDDGTGFVNLSNAGQYSGTDTDVLTISNVQFGQNNFLYRCIVTSGNCETTSSVGRLTIQDNVGLDDINKNIFNVYPNPTSNSFTISSEKVINSEFKIIDAQGREVLTGIMNGQEHTIDISKLSKGVYSVVFDNTEYPMVRVIKE